MQLHQQQQQKQQQQLVLTWLVSSRIVGDLEDVEGDPVDTRLAEGVESGDVRTGVVDLLHHGRHLRVVVVLELDGREGRVDQEEQDGKISPQHRVKGCRSFVRVSKTTSNFDHTEKMNGLF